MKTAIAFVAIVAAVSTSSLAQSNDDEARQKALLECVAFESDAARLACFDAVMSGDNEPSEEIRAAREQETRENFGLSQTEVRERRGDPTPEVEVAVNSTVTATRKEPDGSTTFALANGQIWRTTKAGNMRYELKRGDQVLLREGLIGGYRLEVSGRRGIMGVERIR